MKKYRLKVSEEDLFQLKNLVSRDLPLERGAFALAGINKQKDYTDILVRRIVEVPQTLFRLQNENRLEIHPKATNGLISLCESNNLCAVICHSHPWESDYSPSDDFGEKRIFDTLKDFLPNGFPLISLLFAGKTLKGRVWTISSNNPSNLSEIISIGKTIARYGMSKGMQNYNGQELYNRQVLAFGSLGQKQIRNIKVGIIGVGGTGSSIAEQLIRLGVKDITIVDKDHLEDTNLTRMYGSFQSNFQSWLKFVSKDKVYKVDAIRKHLLRINRNALVTAIRGNIVQHKITTKILDRDFLFLCTDEHWGRSIINQVAYQYLIPTINMGLRIDSNNGYIKGAAGAVDILMPGKPCLWCRGILNSDRIYTESLPEKEKDSLMREGYVEDIDTPAPSVISLTTTLASLAVTHFIHLVTGFNPMMSDIDRINYFVMDSEIKVGNVGEVKPRCICSKNKGFGDLKPLHTVKSK